MLMILSWIITKSDSMRLDRLNKKTENQTKRPNLNQPAFYHSPYLSCIQ